MKSFIIKEVWESSVGGRKSLPAGEAGAAVWSMVLNSLAKWIRFESDLRIQWTQRGCGKDRKAQEMSEEQ